MRPFRHRKTIRVSEPLRQRSIEEKRSAELRLNLRPQSGPWRAAPEPALVDNFAENQVVSTPSHPYAGRMSGKEGIMGSKSHRIAMAQALLAELGEAVARHGETAGTRRLRALVARTVAELLAA